MRRLKRRSPVQIHNCALLHYCNGTQRLVLVALLADALEHFE